MNPLQLPLRVNAGFSFVSGVVLASAPHVVGNWLGIDADLWIRMFGIVLLGHAALLFWSTTRPDLRPFAILNLSAIAPYPLLMIGLVAFGVIDRPLGQALALVDGAIIAGLSLWQWQLVKAQRGIPQPVR